MKSHPKEPRAKSAKNIKSKLTPTEMYKISKRQTDWGIEGYEIPRSYYDYRQVMWHKRRTRILNSAKRDWPPNNWPRDSEDRRIPPKRTSYLDELEKWCKSYYDPKRAEELIEQGVNVNDYVRPRIKDTTRRKNFLENEKQKKEWKDSRPAFPEYKEEAIDAVKEKIEEFEKEKKEVPPIKKILNRYKDRPQTSRCDRVTVVADAEFVGEQIPFYNTPPQDDDSNKKLFYPDKTCTWRRAPAWKYPKNIFDRKTNENFQFKEDAHKEKIEELMNEKGLKNEDLHIQVRQSYHKVKHYGEILLKMVPRTEYEKEEHYVNYKEQNNFDSIGPDHYWRMPKETKNPKKMRSLMQETIYDDKGNKIYYIDRRKTDKFVYKSGMRKSVY